MSEMDRRGMTTRVPGPRPWLSTAAVGIVLLAVLAVHVLVPFLAWRTLRESPTWVTVMQFAVPYLVGLCYLAVAAWSLLRRRNTVQEHPLALACAGVSLLTAARLDAHTSRVLTVLWAAAWPLTAVAFTYLAFAFLSEQAPTTRVSPWRHGALALGTAMAVWTVIALRSPDSGSLVISRLAGFVVLLAGVVAFIGVLVHVRLHPSFIPLRLQAQTMLTGALIAFAPLPLWVAASIVHTLTSGLGLSDPFRPLVYVPLLVAFPLATVYAMRRYALPHAESVFGAFYDAPATMRTALSSLSRELADTPDPDSICEQLLAGVGLLFHAPRAWVFVLSPLSNQYDAFRLWPELDIAIHEEAAA